VNVCSVEAMIAAVFSSLADKLALELVTELFYVLGANSG